jgi:hypothetical protein
MQSKSQLGPSRLHKMHGNRLQKPLHAPRFLAVIHPQGLKIATRLIIKVEHINNVDWLGQPQLIPPNRLQLIRMYFC